MRRRMLLLVAMSFTMLSVPPLWVWSAEPTRAREKMTAVPPTAAKPGRLGVPQNVMCTLSGDTMTITADPVVPLPLPDGTSPTVLYKVMVEADNGVELLDYTMSFPYSHPVSDFTLIEVDEAGQEVQTPATRLEVKLKAQYTKTGKGASKPTKTVICQ